MLKTIKFRNFKPFGNTPTKISFGKVTVFIGENGTGKSSVLQSLALLKQSSGSESLKPGNFKFTSFGSLIHQGQVKRELEISLNGESTVDGHKIPFFYEAIFADPGKLIMQNSQLSGISELLDWDQSSISSSYRYGDARISTQKAGSDNAHVTMSSTTLILMPLAVTGGGYQDENSSPRYRFLYDGFNRLFNVFKNTFDQVFFDWSVGRGFDREAYSLQEKAPESPQSGEDVYSTFAYRRELEHTVSQWLLKITGTGISVHIIPGRLIQMKNSEGYDVYQGGYGTNQLIRPLLLLATSLPGSLVAIEEPETSLHPKAQSNLCDLVAEIAQNDNKQIVLTTHSEHIITGLLNLVTENRLSPEDLKVYFFEKQKQESKVTNLEVDSRGALMGGLKGFFEVNLENYQRHLKAFSRRTEK